MRQQPNSIFLNYNNKSHCLSYQAKFTQLLILHCATATKQIDCSMTS